LTDVRQDKSIRLSDTVTVCMTVSLSGTQLIHIGTRLLTYTAKSHKHNPIY